MPFPPFDPLLYHYPSRRNAVYGRRGMVCTGNPLAAQAGLMAVKAATRLTPPSPRPPL